MKKFSFSLMIFFVALFCSGQELKPVSEDINDVMLVRKFGSPATSSAPMENPAVIPANGTDGSYETIIMETTYDKQSRGALSNRIWNWTDGAISAVWTVGQQLNNSTFTDLGTGYWSNYNPSTYEKLEPEQMVSPSIAGWGPYGEIVVSQDIENNRLVILTREERATGDWTTGFLNGPEGGPGIGWPRMTTSGINHDTIHVFALSIPSEYGGFPWLGQDGALLYSRSTDGGQNWDIQHQQLPGMGQENYLNVNPDDYALVARDSIVVLLVGSPWRDLVMWKSTDNGTTWSKKLIWSHPYPFFDMQNTYTTDTLWTVDGSCDAAIDEYGVAHVVWGIARVARLDYNPPDPGYFQYWPMTDGIGYWSENMESPITPAENPHHTLMTWRLYDLGMLIGWSQDVNGSGDLLDFEGTADPPFGLYDQLGVSSMPSIACVGADYMIVGYSSVTETYLSADGLYNYRHNWVKTSYGTVFHDTQAWNIFHLYDECIYPVFSDAGTDEMPGDYPVLIYQADNFTGLYCDSIHAPVSNRVIHFIHYIMNIDSEQKQTNLLFDCTPNPADKNVDIKFEINQERQVQVQILNLTGQCMLSIPPQKMDQGVQVMHLDISGLKPGVYICSLIAGHEKRSQKIVIQ